MKRGASKRVGGAARPPNTSGGDSDEGEPDLGADESPAKRPPGPPSKRKAPSQSSLFSMLATQRRHGDIDGAGASNVDEDFLRTELQARGKQKKIS